MEELSQLVRQAQQGNHDAYAQVIGRFQDMAFAGAYAMLGDAGLAQDAAQEAFMEAYMSLSKLREPAAFPGWFRRIIIKQSDRQLRCRKVTLVPFEASAPTPSPLPDPAFILEKQQTHADVHTAVAALPTNQRLVITLFYIQGYSQKEIAAFLECPVTTIKKRLFDARQKLKENLIMVEKELQKNKPSQNDEFSSKVQFFIALREGNTAELTSLIKQKPELVMTQTEWPLAADSYYWPLGVPPLYFAAGMGYLDIMQILLDNGADANGGGRLTCLQHAVIRQQPAAVRLLLDKGADIQLASERGLTSLHFAVIRRDGEMVNILLGNGADVNAKDAHGRTPIDWAAYKGYDEIMQQLTSHGAKRPSASQAQEVTVSPPQFRQLPSATAVLGHILDGEGQVRNGRAAIQPTQKIKHSINHPSPVIWETGLKIIDLMAPLKQGGQFAVFTPLSGVGRELVQAELMRSFVTHHEGVVVYLALAYGGATIESKYRQWQAESNLPERLLHERLLSVVAHVDDELAAKQRVAETGLALAQELKTQYPNVLIVVESKLTMVPEVVPFLRQHGHGLTLLFDGDYTVGLEPPIYTDLDAIITFDRARAKQGLWPAIDPIRSTSKLLKRPDLIGTAHIELATAVRQLFTRYQELHHSYEYAQFDALFYLNELESDQQTIIRARRLQRYLTQPLTVSELVTGLPGQYIDLATTLANAQAIRNGDFDDTLEEDLYFIGAL